MKLVYFSLSVSQSVSLSVSRNVQDLHASVARPVSSTNNSNLSTDCAIGIIPDFLVDTFYVIISQSSNVELWPIVARYNDLDFEFDEEEGVEVKPPNMPDRGSSLMIASALVGISDSNFTTGLSGILTRQNTKIETCTLDEFVEIMELRTESGNKGGYVLMQPPGCCPPPTPAVLGYYHR